MVKAHNRQLGRVKKLLVGTAIFILMAHVVTAILDYYLDGSSIERVRGIFNLDGEYNFTAIYSGFLLICCGYFALINGLKEQSAIFRLRWILMTGLFVYIALDEVLVIHERFAEPIRVLLSISKASPFYHAWVLVALVVVAILAGAIFLMHPKDPVSKFQRSIFVYITVLASVIILLEIIGTKLYFSPLLYQLGPVLVEEMIEISMVSFILYKLFEHTFVTTKTSKHV